MKQSSSSLIGLALVLLTACGGSASSEPNTASKANQATPEDSEPSLDVAETSPEPAPKPVDACEGGGCTHCGDAVCLTGFYCDEGVQACAWVPDCGKEPSCGCIEKALSGCSCVERDGGLYVHCN
ncbi:MAG TPA: hypothetical protein VHM70_27905 [Polyangiaceae bacterium]|jgi:hypothetical protein|nr:hypothetical protein [Polyangiaceae bacterium]